MTHRKLSHADLWDELKRHEACMLVTRDGDVLRARPMHPVIDRAKDRIHFVTSAENHKDDEIRQNPDVALTFADNGSMTFISLSGHASISDGRNTLQHIWNHRMDAWFEGGADDPRARLLTVEVTQGEIWDGPSNRLVASLKLALASATDTEPHLGHNEKLSFR